jgi:hypothetical protein
VAEGLERVREIVVKAQRMDMTQSPVSAAELREALAILDRPTVYAAEWGNEFPAEIDTLWVHERDALNHVRELNQRPGSNWHVKPWRLLTGKDDDGV